MTESKYVTGVLLEDYATAEANVQAISAHWHVMPAGREGIIVLHDRFFSRHDVDESLDVNVYYFPGVLVLLLILLVLLGGFLGIRFLWRRRQTA